jgi:hypothetical protein
VHEGRRAGRPCSVRCKPKRLCRPPNCAPDRRIHGCLYRTGRRGIAAIAHVALRIPSQDTARIRGYVLRTYDLRLGGTIGLRRADGPGERSYPLIKCLRCLTVIPRRLDGLGDRDRGRYNIGLRGWPLGAAPPERSAQRSFSCLQSGLAIV